MEKNTNKPETITDSIVNSTGKAGTDSGIITDTAVNPKGSRVYNIQNLKPVRTEKEAREKGRNGGIKSGEVRRQRKTMRESILAMLEKEISPDKLAEYGLDSADMSDTTYQSALVASMLREALNGDTKALTMVRDTIGEQPVARTENRTEVITADDVKVMENFRRSLIG
jgi:hypothetical protein